MPGAKITRVLSKFEIRVACGVTPLHFTMSFYLENIRRVGVVTIVDVAQ